MTSVYDRANRSDWTERDVKNSCVTIVEVSECERNTQATTAFLRCSCVGYRIISIVRWGR